ncbi:MAG: creatininase family protein [Treponema sp.]|jgi:creatinine amidohydrolase|nr:creatininase family protein [Treponema sp.]
MLWEELRANQFSDCIRMSGGVCLLPIGVLEKHGNHLPLGTDMYTGTAVSKRAAEIEPSVVFPYYFLGQISEARHYAGTIAASHRLLMDSLLEMCDEIRRNGFSKIIIASSHGGNAHFIPFFLQEMPRLNRDYNAYTYFIPELKKEQTRAICDYAKTEDMGYHAGLTETSIMMHLRPDLVKMDAQDPHEGSNHNRLADLRERGVDTGFNWYAQYPRHIAGDPSPASSELGKMIFEMMSENLAEIIRLVKADNVSEKMIKEFRLLGEKPQ